MKKWETGTFSIGSDPGSFSIGGDCGSFSIGSDRFPPKSQHLIS